MDDLELGADGDDLDNEGFESTLDKLKSIYGKSDTSEETDEEKETESEEIEEEKEQEEEEEVFETSNRHKKKRETQNERIKRMNRELREENERLKQNSGYDYQQLFEARRQAEIEKLEMQEELLNFKRDQYKIIAEEAQTSKNPIAVDAIAEITRADRELERIKERLEQTKGASIQTNNNISSHKIPRENQEAQEEFLEKHKYLTKDSHAQELAEELANKLNRKYIVSDQEDDIGSPKYMKELDALLTKRIAEDLNISVSGNKTKKRSYSAPVKSSKPIGGASPVLSAADKKYIQSIINLVGEDQAEMVKKSFMEVRRKQNKERE